MTVSRLEASRGKVTTVLRVNAAERSHGATAAEPKQPIDAYVRVLQVQLHTFADGLGESRSLVDLMLGKTVHYGSILGTSSNG